MMVKRNILIEMPVETLNDLQKSFITLSRNLKEKSNIENDFELYTEMNRALDELELQIKHINAALEERLA